jgi:hypothetical protein
VRVFQSRILRKIFWPKRVQETGNWRKLHNEELDDLCSSPNVIWVTLTGNVAYMGRKKEMPTQFWWGNLEEREYLEDLGRDYRVAFKYNCIP